MAALLVVNALEMVLENSGQVLAGSLVDKPQRTTHLWAVSLLPGSAGSAIPVGVVSTNADVRDGSVEPSGKNGS